MNPVVKICCIASVEEARLAVEAGAAALGLVSAMPSGPGVIADETIAEIAATVPPPTRSFLLTCRTDAAAIAAQHAAAGTTTLQLVDHVPHAELQALRRQCPGVELVQVIHVTGESSVAEAVAVAPYVDAILLDSGNPALAVKELGGTGRRHDWAISRRIRDAVWPLPLFLAGGLNPANVRRAVETVQPYGLDLCSGVRCEGRLDDRKLAAFFAALQE
ncbi:N-(5'-phosphoribosyl)anthranilate isomerase [Rubrivivax gelatinosus]|uniref:phosphoribosylanthranilate isomerase n=1 Tax=Rubrivivax gelatinosus TaxID=28068 RepID=UPI00190883D3|nr:N-(5'-phosphoribosyl)anthranilate isomerase [Rubrivivax gelatinosus]